MNKCVMIIDGGLPAGVSVNIAAVLGTALGKAVPEAVGTDVADGDGNTHLGITEIPIPILKGNPAIIGEIAEAAARSGIFSVDFTELAQRCRTYPEYIEKMAQTRGNELKYIGAALYGDKKKINRLTGSLPLL